jgi:hypothetical protein
MRWCAYWAPRWSALTTPEALARLDHAEGSLGVHHEGLDSVPPASVAITISGELISHVRLMLRLAIEDVKSNRTLAVGDNATTNHATAAYILATAAVEAFLNENVLHGIGALQAREKDSALWLIPDDVRERLDLPVKVAMVSRLLCGAKMDAGSQPLQDFAVLVKLRNDLTHYKMGFKAPKYLPTLEQRQIPLPRSEGPEDARFVLPWVLDVSTTNGILWAHNTAASIVSHLAAVDADGLCRAAANTFAPLDVPAIRAHIAKLGVD